MARTDFGVNSHRAGDNRSAGARHPDAAPPRRGAGAGPPRSPRVRASAGPRGLRVPVRPVNRPVDRGPCAPCAVAVPVARVNDGLNRLRLSARLLYRTCVIAGPSVAVRSRGTYIYLAVTLVDSYALT